MTGDSIAIYTPKKEGVYYEEQLSLLDPMNIPHHVALVMDGNRRWEHKNGYPFMSGHWQGADTLAEILRASIQIGIKTLTVYSFSTENNARSVEEIESLMNLFEVYLVRQQKLMLEEGVRLHVIGDIDRLREKTKKILLKTLEVTKEGTTIDFLIAINYGGRDEICRAVRKILEDYEQKRISKEELTEERFSHYLDTAFFPDPDLLIRTGGEKRLSNFLIWQTPYSEVFFEDVFWPDFSKEYFLKAILAYQKRIKRFGR